MAVMVMMLSGGIAHAGDPVAGMALFNNVPDAIISCGNAACHGPNPNDNVNGLQKAGNNAGVIEAAIRVNIRQMMFLNGLLNPFQLDDLAAYLAPQPDLSSTAIAFDAQTVRTASVAQIVTLKNLGGVDLALTEITLAGADASSFTVNSNCSTSAPLRSAVIDREGGACSMSVTFKPSAARSHQASLKLGYAGSTTFPASQSIVLTGTGIGAAVPAIAVDPLSIDFGEIVREGAAQTRTVTISNTGNAVLSLTAIEKTGIHGGEFGVSGSCVNAISGAPVQVVPSGSCVIVVSFSPQGLGARIAALVIRHDANGGVVNVALSGFGVGETCAPPAPSTEFRTLACAAGQTGSMTQSRAYVCSRAAWVAGPWSTVADNCRPDNPPAPLELVEYFNAPLDHYFVTASPDERAAIEAGQAGPGWVRTQTLGRVWIAGAAPMAGGTPICRFYGNPASGADGKRIGPNSHFYTADPDECIAVKADHGWIFEGVVFQAIEAHLGVCAPPLLSVHRNYNQRFRENDSNHRYSTDPAIIATMIKRGWADEGVVFCVQAP